MVRGVTGGVQGGGFLGAPDPLPFRGAPSIQSKYFFNSYLRIQLIYVYFSMSMVYPSSTSNVIKRNNLIIQWVRKKETCANDTMFL